MGRPKGSKNKPKSAVQRDSEKKGTRLPKNKKPAPAPSEGVLEPVIKSGLFEITAERPYRITKGPISIYSNIKTARTKLAEVRSKITAEGGNPYQTVLLPLGPKNEGLLPE